MINTNKWVNEQTLQKMQACFIDKRVIDGYFIHKKYLQLQNSRIKIFYTKIHKENIKIKASILYIHGLGEHSGRNYNLATRLSDLGYEVNMIDFQGHGFSFGPKTYTSQKNLIEDIQLGLQEVRTDLPCFLMGHSMGGGSILAFSQLNPNLKLAGVICSNPFIQYGKQQPVPYLPEASLVIQQEIISFSFFRSLLTFK